MTTQDTDYLIWSNEHEGWWGPGRCGYTRLGKAGVYTRAEAIQICADAVPSADAPWPHL
jgi:hypothetical protein